MEIDSSATEGITPKVVSEATEALTQGAKFQKLSKQGIDRLFVSPIDRNEMKVIISEKLRYRHLSDRTFVALTAYYMELNRWHIYAPRKRAKQKKSEEEAADAELHDLVAEIESRKGAN